MAKLLESEEQVDLAISREDEHAEPQPETLEYFEISDFGADPTQYDAPDASFDYEPATPPRLLDLPTIARPRVLFWIDGEFEVHCLVRGAKGAYLENAEAIVRAIALYLKRQDGIQLELEGDWVALPVIQHLHTPSPNAESASASDNRPSSLEDLLDQVLSDRKTAEDVIFWIEKRTGMLRSFAFHLPNGDVVTPYALMNPVMRTGTKVGTAAVQRLTSTWHPNGPMPVLFGGDSADGNSPFLLAGEVITETRWKQLTKSFEKAEKESKRRKN